MIYTKELTIGEIVSISKGNKHSVTETPTSKAVRIIGIDDLRNDNLVRFTDDHSGTSVNPDDIMIAWDGANAGTIGFGKSGFIGSTIARLRPKGELEFSTPFLAAFLKYNFSYLRKTATGATIPHINRKALEEIKIPNIKFPDQIRIAHVLSTVEGLIAQRKQHLQHLGDLLKGVFLDMFGSEKAIHEEWPVVEIKDLAASHKGAMRTGPFGSNLLHSEFSETGDVAVIGIDNAVQNRFAWDQLRFITNEKYKELEAYRLFPGDVIVTIMGTIGRSAVIPDDIPLAINTKHLAAITVDRTIAHPLFLSYSIHSSPSILKQFKNKNRGAIMNGLNLGLIKETTIYRPPINLQNDFASIHIRVDEIKTRYQNSLADLEQLYAVLNKKSFTGQLDVSRVHLVKTSSAPQDAPINEREDNASSTPKRFTLPEIPSSVARQERIKQWLSAYNEQRASEAPFSMSEFIALVNERLLSEETDEVKTWGVADYDQLKAWIFSALGTGTLAQTYDDQGNRVSLHGSPARKSRSRVP